MTRPLAGRTGPAQKAISAQVEALAAAHRPTAGALPLVLIKGGWSQIGLRHDRDSRALGCEVIAGNLTVRVVPSSHASMYREPYVGAFARALREELARAAQA